MSLFDFLFKRKPKVAEILFTPIREDKGDFTEFLKKLRRSSLILLITGKRGSGKTALGMALLQFLAPTKHCYVLGYTDTKLPGWIKKTDSAEKVKPDSVLLVDEGALEFSARESMAARNKLLTKLMAISRHKGLTLIFIAQSSALIDLNVLRLADVIFFKETGFLQSRFERRQLSDLYKKAASLFRETAQTKESLVYAFSDDFEGGFTYSLPAFWSERISNAFRRASVRGRS